MADSAHLPCWVNGLSLSLGAFFEASFSLNILSDCLFTVVVHVDALLRQELIENIVFNYQQLSFTFCVTHGDDEFDFVAIEWIRN